MQGRIPFLPTMDFTNPGQTQFPPQTKNCAEKSITVVTRDNIRKLRPHAYASPGQTVAKKPTVVDHDILSNVKKSSIFYSKDDLERMSAERMSKKNEAFETAKARKSVMEDFDHHRAKNASLSQLEKEAKTKSDYLLAKAHHQIEEQEDEIKRLNELILYAKCVTIRDDQVIEKELIKKEIKEEDKRLDALMEIERVVELKKLEQREAIRKERIRQGGLQICAQIKEREETALIEREKKELEKTAALKGLADLAELDRKDKNKKLHNQKSLLKDVVQAYKDCLDEKVANKKLHVEEDNKILQYLVEKDKKAFEKDQETKKKNAEKEKEMARLRAAQTIVTDKVGERDALQAKRAFEQYERDWRRKGKELAENQAFQEHTLKTERETQHHARQHALALEAQNIRDQFFESIEKQKREDERCKTIDVERAENNRKYANDIKEQIKEKRVNREKEREDFFREGVRLAQERTEKKHKIDSVKGRKIDELRSVGVPSKYCTEVEKKAYNIHEKFSTHL